MKAVDFYLIRGLAREAAHWGGFAELLAEQNFSNKVTCLDLPGAGKFYRLKSPLKISEYAEFLLTQIEESEVPKVIVSISLGSMVAMEMLRLQPEMFKKAYVMNTSFSNLSPFYHRLQLNALKRFWNIGRAKSLEERELECLKMVSQKPERWVELSKEFAPVAKERPVTGINFFRQLFAAATYKIKKEKPKTPIIVLSGLGDKMVHPSCSKELASHWDLPLWTHSESGHDIAIDAPGWIIKVIEETLWADS